MIRVTVWEEFVRSQTDEEVKRWYPNGLHEYIASFLKEEPDLTVNTAHFNQEECGLSQDMLNNTDVLIWWAHNVHEKVPDEIAERVCERVLQGMGIVFLHSAHMSKPFKKLMGTSGSLRWREVGENERLWVIAPSHPLVAGIGDYIELAHEEMYGEHFDIATPDEVVMLGWFKGGEVFRSLCTWNRGYGKVVYFQPGHETYPNYHDSNIQRVIKNAVHFTYAEKRQPQDRSSNNCPNIKIPLEQF